MIEAAPEKIVLYGFAGSETVTDLGSGTYQHTFTPANMTIEDVAGLLGSLRSTPIGKNPYFTMSHRIYNELARLHKVYTQRHKYTRRLRRQNRAIFRRRKRGLA